MEWEILKKQTENKLRPLIFRNFFRNIQKIKNGLRIICCALHHRHYVAEQAAEIAFGWQLGEKSPPRGSLDTGKGKA